MLTGTKPHLRFRKSSYSQPTGNCVDVAEHVNGAAIRDTQNREAGHLGYPVAEWVVLISSVRL